MRTILAAVLATSLAACASLEGTRDTSSTVYRKQPTVQVATVGVLSPAKSAAADRLDERVGAALVAALRTAGLRAAPGKASGASHYLVVRAISLDREKIRAVDIGRTGVVSDANNVIRSRLRFDVDLVDVRAKTVVWRGVGSAENIDSPRKDLDFGVVSVQQRSPEIEQFLPEMLMVSAEGVAREIAGTHE